MQNLYQTVFWHCCSSWCCKNRVPLFPCSIFVPSHILSSFSCHMNGQLPSCHLDPFHQTSCSYPDNWSLRPRFVYKVKYRYRACCNNGILYLPRQTSCLQPTRIFQQLSMFASLCNVILDISMLQVLKWLFILIISDILGISNPFIDLCI